MLDLLKTHIAEGHLLRLTITVTPKSQQNKILNCQFDQKTNQFNLKVKVRGLPEKGQVNENLINYLSKELGLPKSVITIISGFTSRQKIISIHALQQ